MSIRLFEQSFSASHGKGGAFDAALSRALLDSVARGETPEALRLYRPGAVVSFSGHDAAQPGFAQAVRAARAGGFDAALRSAGGRAAVFHEQSIAFAWCIPDPAPRRSVHRRFAETADIFCEALASLGIDARRGAVPGEYCPGDYSVNAGGSVKLMGVGQRLVRGAAYLGGVLVLDDAQRMRDVLRPVYAALELDFDPKTVGAVRDVAPPCSREDVLHALSAAWRRRAELEPGGAFPAALTEAGAAAEAAFRL